MKIGFRFPGGRSKALTMSYDDGVAQDLRLAALFDEYGIRGTFHLNSGVIGRERKLTEQDVRTALKNHEVSCHGVTHPFLERLPALAAVGELYEDRRALEKLCGYPVRGMSYPYGTHDAQVREALRAVGIEYSRTTKSTKNFGLPDDFMQWNPTCHHRENLDGVLTSFLEKKSGPMQLLYVWGHSFEFDKDDNWNVIEDFCRRAGGRDEIWYATNIELCDYITAMRGLRVSADLSTAYNPYAVSVWAEVEGKTVEFPSGRVTRLAE